MKKRLLSVLLSLTMALGLFSATAWADEAAPTKNTTVPQTPRNVSVKVTSMQQGSMSAYGYETHSGTIMGMSVSLRTQAGITQYFVAPLRKATIGGNTDLIKADIGNMPFIRANQGGGKPPVWMDTDKTTGNNGETLTEQGDTLTAQVKVCVYDSEPQYPSNGFVKGETVLVEVRAENSDLPQSSDPVMVKIPADPSSVGKTFNEKGEVKQEGEEDDEKTGEGEKEKDKPEDEPGEDTDLTITSVKLNKTSFTWSGKVQKPTVKKVLSGNKIVPATGYRVKMHTPKSKNAGTYYITVTGKGGYAGKVKLPYTIRQKEVKDLPNVAGATATGGKGSIKVEWTPLSAKERKKRKVKKVLVRYQYTKDAKTYEKAYQYPNAAKKAKKVSVLVKNIKKKGRYKVQIRCLGEGNKNTQHVSKKWSKWQTAKVK